MKKILTISIAAYNVEKYIEKTLNSILKSKYKDEIDIVVTNDGSKDKTGSIICKYKERYPEIINFIDQENGGAGSTVNNGIKNAKGKYFKMVDGDDWVVTENLDILISYLKENDCDAVISNLDYFYEKDKSIKKGPSYNLENNKIFQFEEVCNMIGITTHTVTYRTSILQDNCIEVSKRYYSDYQFQVYPMPFIKTISYLDVEIYVYRIGREGQSISIKGYQSHIDDHQKVMFKLLTYFELNKEKCNNNVKKYMLKRLSTFINTDLSVMLSFRTNKQNKEKIIELVNEIKKNSLVTFEFAKNEKILKILINSKYKLYFIMSIIKRLKNRV